MKGSKVKVGVPDGSDGKETICNAGDPGFDPWVGKIPWRRAWKPTPVFLPGESPWKEEPGGLHFMGLQKSQTQLWDEPKVKERSCLSP